MKIFLFLTFSLLIHFGNAQSHFDLKVRVTNLDNNRGVVQLGLYNTATKFPKVGKTYKMVRLKTHGMR